MILILFNVQMSNKYIISKYISEKIKELNNNEIQEIFKLFHHNNVSYTKNNNGIFVNLSWTDMDILEKINNYIIFCINSHKETKKHEILKDELCNSIKKDIDNNDDISVNNETETVIDEAHVKIKKINSNMKFYLTKKKLDFKKDIHKKFLMDDTLTYDIPI